jgi:hypothetical protein
MAGSLVMQIAAGSLHCYHNTESHQITRLTGVLGEVPIT